MFTAPLFITPQTGHYQSIRQSLNRYVNCGVTQRNAAPAWCPLSPLGETSSLWGSGHPRPAQGTGRLQQRPPLGPQTCGKPTDLEAWRGLRDWTTDGQPGPVAANSAPTCQSENTHRLLETRTILKTADACVTLRSGQAQFSAHPHTNSIFATTSNITIPTPAVGELTRGREAPRVGHGARARRAESPAQAYVKALRPALTTMLSPFPLTGPPYPNFSRVR